MNRLNHNVFEDSDCEDYPSKSKLQVPRVVVAIGVVAFAVLVVIAAIKNVG